MPRERAPISRKRERRSVLVLRARARARGCVGAAQDGRQTGLVLPFCFVFCFCPYLFRIVAG